MARSILLQRNIEIKNVEYVCFCEHTNIFVSKKKGAKWNNNAHRIECQIRQKQIPFPTSSFA